jgi:predicted dehydrogenase
MSKFSFDVLLRGDQTVSKPFSMTRRQFVATTGVVGGAVLAGPWAMAAQDHGVAVALLGVAHLHTPMYLQILKSREDVKIKYVWDYDPARAAKIAEACGAKVARSAAEAVDDAEVAGVAVLSETSLHAELATLAAKAKKHVFIEKPIGAGAKDAAEIADAVEKAGILFTTGYHLRTIPKYIFIKQQIDKGNFDRIVRLECSFSNDCLLQGVFDKEFKWTVDPKWGAMGGFADTGTHALDMLMWLMGDVEAVSADIRTVTNRYAGCDETGQALIRFRNGVTASLSAGWIEPENPVALLVSGTAGHAVVFNDHLYLRTKKVAGADGARPWGKLPPGPDHPVLQFVSAIAGRKDVALVTAREAAARVKVMEALYQAARQRQWVTIGSGIS